MFGDLDLPLVNMSVMMTLSDPYPSRNVAFHCIR